MAQAPLSLRTYSASIFQSSPHIAGPQSKKNGSMNYVSRASQLSGSTAHPSSSSLSSLSSATTLGANGGASVVATANIINQKADASRSLYQMCLSLKQRLAKVPDFEPFLEQLDPYDPVDPLWNLFRTGYPLLTIYNSLQPDEPLKVDDPNANEAKKQKIAIFRFIQACMKDLRLPSSENFVIADLTKNDTSGFVKVISVVNHVLDVAEKNGNLLQIQPYPEDEPINPAATSQMTYRDHIVKELVDTERKYVQDLENLQDLKKTLEQKGSVPGDIVHQIFLNISFILDFQRRFLIRIETTNSMPSASQRWGSPFTMFEDSFDLYQPFIANQRKAAQVASQVFDKIQAADHPVAADFNTLDGFLLKPMQRLVKYPLLLKDLNKKTEEVDTKEDLVQGCEAAERVLQKANEAVNRDLLDEALDELMGRVDDWKNHKLDTFGRLLLHGVYGVITGKSEQEKDYEIFLFENILLCCKEVSATKSKDKKDKTRSSQPKIKAKNAKLQLKGRIFMTNVTEVVSMSKPGSHSVQIWWKGDPGVEMFTIRFVNEDRMKKWAVGLEMQRKENAPRTSMSPDGTTPDFNWTRDHAGGLENPYLQQQHDDEEDEDGANRHHSGQFPMPRTSSNNNLRQRSTTGESTQSLATIARQPPPRFPLPVPPAALSLQTPTGGSQSPGARAGDSYFSPIENNSPASSSRTSAASGVFPPSGYPFAKSSTPQPGWDENNRRNPRGPSLPAMATNQQSALQQQRSRSYSTPDINAPGAPRQRQPSSSNVPHVPSIPQHLHPAHDNNIPRSQTGSPRNDIPIRSNTQSPGVQRERQHKHSGSLGGNLTQFSSQSGHSRVPTNSSQTSNPLRVDSMSANSRAVSPALGTGSIHHSSSASASFSPDLPLPTQLKVRVNCDSGNYVTLVVAFNITYQSLIDRIDAKLARFTNSSIGKSMLKLRYSDEDGDLVTIESDDDIQIAFGEYREGLRNMYSGGVGEIELFCVGDMSA